MRRRFLYVITFFLAFASPSASAGTDYADVLARYPKPSFILGVGESRKSGDRMNDQRVAEVTARLEIARQIRVHVREQTIDVMCGGKRSALFKEDKECRNEFLMVIEESVDLFLENTRIAEKGERDNVVFAVAVLEREKAAGTMEEKSGEAADRAKADLEKSRAGDPDARKQAVEEYKKAVVYDRERELLSGVRSRANRALDELEKALVEAGGP